MAREASRSPWGRKASDTTGKSEFARVVSDTVNGRHNASMSFTVAYGFLSADIFFGFLFFFSDGLFVAFFFNDGRHGVQFYDVRTADGTVYIKDNPCPGVFKPPHVAACNVRPDSL